MVNISEMYIYYMKYTVRSYNSKTQTHNQGVHNTDRLLPNDSQEMLFVIRTQIDFVCGIEGFCLCKAEF